MTDTSLNDQEYFWFHKNISQLVFLKHSNMLWHFITPEGQKNYTVIRRMCIKSGSLRVSSLFRFIRHNKHPALRNILNKINAHFKKFYWLVFLLFFTSYTLVAIPLKKPSTFPSCSTKLHFQKCIKCIIIQNPMIHARINRKSVH